MNRRAFLRAFSVGLAATAATAAIDPEFLLWRPGAKAIFIPPTNRLWSSVDVLGGLGVGDVISFDGLYETHPATGLTLGFPKQFIITADVSAYKSVDSILRPPCHYRGQKLLTEHWAINAADKG